MRTLLLALALAAPASPVPVTERAQLGPVTAELTYLFDEKTDNLEQRYAQMHVRVTRTGSVLVDADLQPLCAGCSVWPAGGGDPKTPSISVRDLDGDGEPEVVVDLYSGGAHCCEYSLFFRYTGAMYTRHVHWWGNPGYRVRDFDRDGRPEFVTGDDRFNYAFSCYACSVVPILIQQYRGGRLVNVTRRFRARVTADAARTWGYYRYALRHRLTPAGILPAYLADEYLLGRSKAAWARVRAAVARRNWPSLVSVDPPWKNRLRYLHAVRRFLVMTGYA